MSFTSVFPFYDDKMKLMSCLGSRMAPGHFPVFLAWKDSIGYAQVFPAAKVQKTLAIIIHTTYTKLPNTVRQARLSSPTRAFMSPKRTVRFEFIDALRVFWECMVVEKFLIIGFSPQCWCVRRDGMDGPLTHVKFKDWDPVTYCNGCLYVTNKVIVNSKICAIETWHFCKLAKPEKCETSLFDRPSASQSCFLESSDMDVA